MSRRFILEIVSRAGWRLFRWRGVGPMSVFRAAVSATALLGWASTAWAAAPPAPPSIIHAGELLQTPGKAPLSQATLVVQDGLVKEVRAGFLDSSALGLPGNTQV